MAPRPHDPDYRPLLPQAPLPTADGIELDLGTRKVSVTGAPEQLMAIAARCDGRHSAAAIVAEVEGVESADLAELMTDLAEAGAVVDAGEAWRVFHRWSGVDSGLLRPVSTAAVAATLAERYEQPEAGAPVAIASTSTAIDGLLARRRSSDMSDQPRPVEFDELSTLLASMYAGDGHQGRPVPSGGGLYPLALHVVLRTAVGPLGAGAWWYDPAAGELRRVRAGAPAIEQAFADDADTQAKLAWRQAVVVVSADVARGARKYSSRAYRLALIEVGAVAQNAYLAATHLGVPIRAMLGLRDAEMTGLLRLPAGTVPLLGLLVGR